MYDRNYIFIVEYFFMKLIAIHSFRFLSLLAIVLAGLFSIPLHAQKVSEKDKNKILVEGLALYTLTLANWTSNDLYYENEFNTGIVKGYLSYRDKDTVKTIFWRETDTASAAYKATLIKSVGDSASPKKDQPNELTWVVKTIRYRNMNVSKTNSSIADEDERVPTPKEKMLIEFRATAYEEIRKDTSFFKLYAGTKHRAVLLETGKEIKVYVYSSVIKEGIVPIGGDYLLVYDKKQKILLSKEDLHKDCIFISTQYNGKQSDASKATIHTHKKEASELITPTDIATLLLYKSQLEWDEHHVVSDKNTCIFTLIDKKLAVMSTNDYKQLKNQKLEAETIEKKSKMH